MVHAQYWCWPISELRECGAYQPMYGREQPAIHFNWWQREINSNENSLVFGENNIFQEKKKRGKNIYIPHLEFEEKEVNCHI